jgi:DNA-binding XRE family transcriptional regulator
MSANQPVFVLHEVTTCPHCGLRGYLTENGQCRRCHRPLGVEYLRLSLSEFVGGVSNERLSERAGSALRALRAANGISQQGLARAAGIGRSQLSRIECGHVLPSLRTLLQLAGLCGLTVVILRFEKGRGIGAP